MSEHTKGPWEVYPVGKGDSAGSYSITQDAAKRAVGRPGATYAVAYIRGDPRSEATNEANAALIAAAPELAESLVALLAVLGFAHIEVATKQEDEQITAAAQAARSALRKAGVQP